MGGGGAHKGFSEVWRVLTTTTDVGDVTQGPGAAYHQVLHISGAQHFQELCLWPQAPAAGERRGRGRVHGRSP